MIGQDVTRSWFAVLCNPEQHGYQGTPTEICQRLRDEWVAEHPTRTGAWAYCVSADGMQHVHMVLEDTKAMRFSVIKKSYAVGIHLEPTKGSKTQAEAYITKSPPYDEQGEEVICVVREGTIRANPGQRTDLEQIRALLDEGLTPQQVMDCNISYRRYERIIKGEYLRRRYQETPVVRQVAVHLLVGDSGSGKTYRYAQLCEEYGEDAICLVTDYSLNGGLDNYVGQKILYMDEYKGQLPYGTMLTILDKYKSEVHARYSNIIALWEEVYITSVYPPEVLYELMVPEAQRRLDSCQQLYRRITDITYCYRAGDRYQRYTIPMVEYQGYGMLRRAALIQDAPPLQDQVGG